MELTDKFTPVKDVISTEMDGETVLMHVSQGKYLSLNETGSLLWKKLEEGESSLKELIQIIIDEYEVNEAICRSDVEKLLESMIGEGILAKKS